jgi:hypothetical protein
MQRVVKSVTEAVSDVGLGVHKFSKNLGAISEILDARRMTWSKFHPKDVQILGVTIQNLVTTVTLDLGFVHPCVGKSIPFVTGG